MRAAIFLVICLLTWPALSADFDSAADAYRAKDYRTALTEFSELAAMDDARAQTVIALMYKYGEGTAQDLETAFNWYEKAALQGYAPAQYHAGTMLADGIGTKKDVERAIHLLGLAATAGFDRANEKLLDLNSTQIAIDSPAPEFIPWSQNWDFNLPAGIRMALPPEESTGGFRVQLGAMSSAASAELLWRLLSRGHPELFADYPLLVKESVHNLRTLYRVQTGPFETFEAAFQFCQRLTASALNQGCLPLQPSR